MATIFTPANPATSDSFTPKSSFISLCDYDANSKTMTISFKTGSQHRYLYVFPATWTSFKEAKDHSSYYTNAIKGKLMSIPLVRHPIGKPRPKALKENRSPNNVGVFNAGIRHIRNERQSGQPQRGNIPAQLSR